MKPIQLGVTGGIGSGKSIVCRILSLMGIPVYDADREARKLLETAPEVRTGVEKLIGPAAYFEDGTANRAHIAQVVFADASKLESLNKMIHPAVQNHYRRWVTSHPDVPIVVKEAAIMFESGSYLDMNFVVVVSAPEEKRIQRVMERDGKSEDQVKAIISKQLNEVEVIKRSDYVIYNDDKNLLTPQVLELIRILKLKTS